MSCPELNNHSRPRLLTTEESPLVKFDRIMTQFQLKREEDQNDQYKLELEYIQKLADKGLQIIWLLSNEIATEDPSSCEKQFNEYIIALKVISLIEIIKSEQITSIYQIMGRYRRLNDF